MLLMFALRRPDILPVGDLGVQRGMVLFHLAGREGPSINKRKKKPKGHDEEGEEEKQEAWERDEGDNKVAKSLAAIGETTMTESQVQVEEQFSQQNQQPTGPYVSPEPSDEAKVFEVARQRQNDGMQPLPTEQGITQALLKSRKDGKKAKGNVYLTWVSSDLSTSSILFATFFL